jgi:hypothetical protein
MANQFRGGKSEAFDKRRRIPAGRHQNPGNGKWVVQLLESEKTGIRNHALQNWAGIDFLLLQLGAICLSYGHTLHRLNVKQRERRCRKAAVVTSSSASVRDDASNQVDKYFSPSPSSSSSSSILPWLWRRRLLAPRQQLMLHIPRGAM